MKNTSKVFLATVLGLGLTVAGVSSAHAAGVAPQNGRTNFINSLVTALVQKFNLNQTDVQQVVNDTLTAQKAQAETNREQAFKIRLDKAVTGGKITQDQENKILAEEASIKTQIQALSGKTGQDYKTALKQIMDSVTAWATANNIPKQYLMPEFSMHGIGKGFKMGFFMGRHWGPNGTSTPPVTQ